MLRNGRSPIADFEAHELLYLRYGADEFVDGQLDPAAIRFPKQSVNRGSLSEPEDVLFDEGGRYDGLGVVDFRVEDIPPQVVGDQDSIFNFSMHHVPLELNYAHSEIWSVRSGEAGECKKPSPSVKLKFRIQLAQRIQRANVRIEATRNKY